MENTFIVRDENGNEVQASSIERAAKIISERSDIPDHVAENHPLLSDNPEAADANVTRVYNG